MNQTDLRGSTRRPDRGRLSEQTCQMGLKLLARRPDQASIGASPSPKFTIASTFAASAMSATSSNLCPTSCTEIGVPWHIARDDPKGPDPARPERTPAQGPWRRAARRQRQNPDRRTVRQAHGRERGRQACDRPACGGALQRWRHHLHGFRVDTFYFAEQHHRLQSLTLLTNSTAALTSLARADHTNHLFLLGGEFSIDLQETLGQMALDQLEQFHAEHAVLTVGAVMTDGIYDFD